MSRSAAGAIGWGLWYCPWGPLCELLGFPAGKGRAILRKQGSVWHFYDVASKSHKHHLCHPLLVEAITKGHYQGWP